MKRLALHSALSARAGGDAVKVVADFDWDVPKTKTAKRLLEAMGLDGKVLIVTRRGDEIADKSFRNLPEARILDAGQLNTYDVLWSDAVVFAREALPSTGADVAEESADGEEEE
jgi:large subunit ribosomal protein L4